MSETLTLKDNGLIALYRLWSEERYCAGFMDSTEKTVRMFRAWLRDLQGTWIGSNIEDYEHEMLAEYYKQKKATHD